MTYNDALDYIHRISWTGSRPGLERITELCRLLGNPQDKLRFVHVAGTNGKGSFCSILSSVLREAGFKTGTYTSPYVYRFNERMEINGLPVEDGKLAELTARVKILADTMADPPTEFELITALAFLWFCEEKCDIVVLEVGLGGRLDATNIIKTPLISVITGISLDHTRILGDTVEKIAAEKAGIIKPSVPVLCGCEPGSSSADVIRNVAAERHCAFSFMGDKEITLRRAVPGETVFDYRDNHSVRITLSGLYQPRNAARVLDAITALRNSGLNIPEQAVRNGLANAKWRARFEFIRIAPPIVFDGSHNPEGIAALADSLGFYYPGVSAVLLTGVMRDKDYHLIAQELSALADCAFTFAPDNPRALPPGDYAAALAECGVDSQPFDSPEDALNAALKRSEQQNSPLVICGSLYSYAEIRRLLEAKGI